MAEEEAAVGFLLEIWEARYPADPRPREALSSRGEDGAAEAIRAAVAAAREDPSSVPDFVWEWAKGVESERWLRYPMT